MGVHTTEIVETDHDQKVVPIEEIEGEHERVLSLPEVGYNVDVHGAHYHGDTSNYKNETHLQRRKGAGMFNNTNKEGDGCTDYLEALKYLIESLRPFGYLLTSPRRYTPLSHCSNTGSKKAALHSI